MSQLESELSLLSDALLGESLEEVDSYQETLGHLKSGAGPFSLTLLWGDDMAESQTLVLHEWSDGEVVLFDPTHTLSTKGGTGMVRVSEQTLEGWFSDNEAVALIGGESGNTP